MPFSTDDEQQRQQALREQEARKQERERQFPVIARERLIAAAQAAMTRATERYRQGNAPRGTADIALGDIMPIGMGYDAGIQIVESTIFPSVKALHPEWIITWWKPTSEQTAEGWGDQIRAQHR